MKGLKIVVASCDAYADCWEPWNLLKERYWTEEKAALLTETAHCDELFETIAVDKKPWTVRIAESLKLIKETYVIFMCDDHFIRQPVDIARIEHAFEMIKKSRKVAAINFETAYRPVTQSDIEGFGLQAPMQIYNHSCQPSLWRRAALIKELEKVHGTAQEWELKKDDGEFVYYLNTGEPIIDIGYKDGKWMGMKNGKWVKEDMEALNAKEGLGIDLAKRGTC